MRICYLIAAHNTPNHLERLVAALARPEDAIYVHIDAKSDVSQFMRPGLEGAIFLPDRVSVSWGGFSQVQATLNLMRSALAAGEPYDYYCFISGSDYPLRSTEYIHEYLLKNKGKEFINLVEMPNEAAHKPISRLSTYRVDDGDIRKYIRSGYLAHSIARVIDKLALQRDWAAALEGLRPYAGSSWWILSGPAVRHVADFTSGHPALVDFFRHTQFPDESFFQTIIGNSSFGKEVVGNVTFTDWSRETGPYPAFIDDAHVRSFSAGDLTVNDGYGSREALFARKFPDDSASLVELIQKSVW